jgi:conjugative relaxase-like TrwC/TraI family protein
MCIGDAYRRLMLSTAKIRTGSWRYYAHQVGHGACEYFLGVGEAPGRWYGRGLDQVGLTKNDRVAERELEALFGRALHPGSGEQLGRAWRADGVTGYDLCFSAPKSVSVLWALSDSELSRAVRWAHAAAVRAGLDYLDGHAGFSRTGRNGLTQVSTDGFATAVFDHRTSRAGDPQLHTHALVVNKVQCPDGQWRTVDGHEIYAHKKSAGTVYQAALRNELTRRLGVTWTQVSRDGQAEIAGVPAELVKRWSTRARQVAAESAPVVAAYEQRLGRPLSSAERTAVSKVAVIKTRPHKDPVNIVALTHRWETEAAQVGWTPDRLLDAVAGQAQQPRESEAALFDVERVVDEAVVAAGNRNAVFTRNDLAVEVAARLPVLGITAQMTRELVERVTDRALATSETVTLLPEHDGPIRASDARYASATTVNRELEIIAVAERGQRIGAGVCDRGIVLAACRAAGLDVSQVGAVAQLTRGGDQISVLVAPAGTGKTTAMVAATSAWQRSGYQVMALAPSARAAKELATATGLGADTVAKFLHEQGQWPINPRYQVTAGGVVIVDEASMLGTRDLHELTQIVTDMGGKLTLVGDPAQISAVDTAGGMLGALADRLGAPSLSEVHRFHHPWERAASLQLRSGDPAAIDAYLAHDRIHPIAADADPYEQVLAEYRRLVADGGRVLLLARTHDDVDQLNQLARQAAIATGQVHGDPLLTAGDHDWRVGDQLRATRNNRHIPVGGDHLRNGDRFTVTGTTHGGLTVQRIDSTDTAVLPVDYLTEHARYGWASTIDAAQGATVDHALLLARPGMDRSRLYVGMSRGRDTNQIYLAPAPDPEITPRRPGAVDQPDPVAQLRVMLAQAGEHAVAHSQLPDTQPAAPQPLDSQEIDRSQRPTAPVARSRYRDDDTDNGYTLDPYRHDHGRDTGRGR